MKNSKQQLNMARLLATLTAVFLLFAMLPPVQAAGASGSCGNGVSWTLDAGVLTISGNGAMDNYTENDHAPWRAQRQTIHSIVVESGVTHVGNFAFRELQAATTVHLADSVKTIGQYAFYDCNAVHTVKMSNGVTEIGRSAFERCRSLKSITLPGSLQTIRRMAFYRCESLITVTVPASVAVMEEKVFTYCSGLRSAVIMANIRQLPYWTFYGCYDLVTVSLSSSITSVGVSAFENCDQLTQANYGGTGSAAQGLKDQLQNEAPQLDSFKESQNLAGEPDRVFDSTQTQEQNGTTVSVDKHLFTGQDSKIDTQTTHSSQGSTVTMDAVLENQQGWEDVEQQLSDTLGKYADVSSVDIHTYLQNTNEVSATDLNRFAGKDVEITIHTPQGSIWRVNGKDLRDAKLKDKYRLSYTLTPLEELTQQQQAVIGLGKAYILVFDDSIDFNIELELTVGQPRNIASFLVMENSDAYTLKQRVVIDPKGIAHFYLGAVDAQVPYLIGINIPDITSSKDPSDAIVPESMYNEYPPVEIIDAKYLNAQIQSTMGITGWQLALILGGVLLAAAAVVFFVMRALSKRKYQNEKQ